MTRLRFAALSLGVASLAAFAWFGVLRPRPMATWLRVETPSHAILDKGFPVRVTLDAPVRSAQLAVDLHWLGSRSTARGFLVGSPPQRVDARQEPYTFELPVDTRPDLGQVQIILFLSPTGRWEDRIESATTAPIPVQPHGTLGPVASTPAYAVRSESFPPSAPSPALRISIAVLWLLSSIALWRRGARPGLGRDWLEPVGSRGVRLRWLAAACLLAALWELSTLETFLPQIARAAALEHDLYAERFWTQQWITLAFLAGVLAWLAITLRGSPLHRKDVIAAALGLYAGISLSSVVSLHEIDRILSVTILSIPSAQVAKLFVAIAVLVLASRGTRSSGPDEPRARSDRTSTGVHQRASVRLVARTVSRYCGGSRIGAGGGTVGVGALVESGMISRSSQCFEPSPIDHTPIVPDVGRVAVASVQVACHTSGSALEFGQIFARIEFPLPVGLTSSRKRYHWPGCGTTPVIGCAQLGVVPWAESSNALVL